VRQLVAFERVSLSPGETKSVTLRAPVRSFAYYDAAQKTWVAESLTYTAHVGTSSRDLPLTASFQIQ
jgi:beta-glucosidase